MYTVDRNKMIKTDKVLALEDILSSRDNRAD